MKVLDPVVIAIQSSPVWKDITSYRRSDKDRLPTTFETQVGDLQLVVTCSHIYYPGKWVFHCSPWFDTHPLGEEVNTLDQAKKCAIKLLVEKIRRINSDVISVYGIDPL